jgi:hypothetical protein
VTLIRRFEGRVCKPPCQRALLPLLGHVRAQGTCVQSVSLSARTLVNSAFGVSYTLHKPPPVRAPSRAVVYVVVLWKAKNPVCVSPEGELAQTAAYPFGCGGR